MNGVLPTGKACALLWGALLNTGGIEQDRRRIPTGFLVCACIAAIVGVAIAGYLTDWFGLGFSEETIRVVTEVNGSMSDGIYASTWTSTYHRDSHGNLGSITDAGTNDGVESFAWTFSFDADGVPCSFGEFTTITPSKDDLGHVVSMRYENAEGVVITASYGYHGDTDKIQSITYHPESAGDYADIFADLDNPMSPAVNGIFPYIAVGDCAPFVTLALPNLRNCIDCCITFDEDGTLVSYDDNGEVRLADNIDHACRSYASMPTVTRNDEMLGRCKPSVVLDENGMVVSVSTVWLDKEQSSDLGIEYTTVEEPSRWIATVGRLH